MREILADTLGALHVGKNKIAQQRTASLNSARAKLQTDIAYFQQTPYYLTFWDVQRDAEAIFSLERQGKGLDTLPLGRVTETLFPQIVEVIGNWLDTPDSTGSSRDSRDFMKFIANSDSQPLHQKAITRILSPFTPIRLQSGEEIEDDVRSGLIDGYLIAARESEARNERILPYVKHALLQIRQGLGEQITTALEVGQTREVERLQQHLHRMSKSAQFINDLDVKESLVAA